MRPPPFRLVVLMYNSFLSSGAYSSFLLRVKGPGVCFFTAEGPPGRSGRPITGALQWKHPIRNPPPTLHLITVSLEDVLD